MRGKFSPLRVDYSGTLWRSTGIGVRGNVKLFLERRSGQVIEGGGLLALKKFPQFQVLISRVSAGLAPRRSERVERVERCQLGALEGVDAQGALPGIGGLDNVNSSCQQPPLRHPPAPGVEEHTVKLPFTLFLEQMMVHGNAGVTGRSSVWQHQCHTEGDKLKRALCRIWCLCSTGARAGGRFRPALQCMCQP